MEKEFNSRSLMEKRHGAVQARRMAQRLSDLRAAATLEDMRNLPGRCHALLYDRAGQFSLDLEHPHRLIFRPIDAAQCTNDAGWVEWNKVTAVEIIEIADTHE